MSDKFKIIDDEVYERTQFSQRIYPYENVVNVDFILEDFFQTDKGKFAQERGKNFETFYQNRPDIYATETAIWGYMKPQDRTYMVLKYEDQNQKIS
jgi:hypothetical protein